MTPSFSTKLFLLLALLTTGQSSWATSSDPLDPPVYLAIGHTDLGVGYSTNEGWNLHVGYDVTEEEFEPNAAVFQVNAEAKTTIPSGSQFAFLGQPGDPIWILPQAQNERLLYLGFGGEELPEGIFKNDQIEVRLIRVTGPGSLFAYQVDAFGTPLIRYNSADGISPIDVARIKPGGDAHLSWAFTQPGRYTMTVQAEGTLLANGQTSASSPVDFHFLVKPTPVELVNEHVDIRANYDATAEVPLRIIVRDEDHKRNLMAEEARLIVQPNAELTLPEGTPFGPAGASIWAIPQSQDTSLLYLGLSAEGLPPIFTGPIKFELKRLEGPGDFFVWQAGSIGGFDVKFSSRNGLDEEDVHFQILNSHEHFNWGFTKPGIYRAYFQASTMIGGQTVQSAETPLFFEVRPVPPPVGFAAWQAAHFPEGSIQSVIGPGADLDQDGVPNLLEYAFGLDPNEARPVDLPVFSQITLEGRSYGGLSYKRIKGATDLVYRVEVTADFQSWTELKTTPQLKDLGEREEVLVADEMAMDNAGSRFYRLRVELTQP